MIVQQLCAAGRHIEPKGEARRLFQTEDERPRIEIFNRTQADQGHLFSSQV